MIRNELKLKLNLYIDLYKSINETLHNLLDSSKKEISNILVILEKLENEILRIDNNEILENILNYLQKDFIEIDKLYKNPLENKYNRIDNLLINLHKKIEIDLVKLLETSEKDNINNDLYYTLAESIVEEKEIEFIYGGAKKYFDEILENKDKYNLFENDEINIFETYLRKSSDFYYDYLYDLDRFNNLNLSKKTEIIYLFLKDDLPNWIIEETEYSSEDNSSNEDDVRDINSDDISKIDIINQPFEVESLYRMYAREPKELELSPDYQRNFVWKPKQKSKLIESILIRIPLPTFYIDTRNEDQWVVIDGLQRLTTIFTYMDNKFKLTNLEYMPELNGKYWKSLDRKYQRKIEKYSLLCNLIRPGTPSKIASNIFQRINTLGTKLEIQEIRNAMFIGKSTKLLIKLSKSNEFIEIITEKKKKTYSNRKEDHAIILRYLSFKLTNYMDYKTNDMPTFLENTMEKINHMDDLEINKLEDTFLECMRKGKILFEKEHFAKPSKRKDRSNPISKTIFESICFILDKYPYEEIEKYKFELRNKINELYVNEEFILKTSIATNNVSNVHYRFNKFKEIFKEIIGY
jgi:hypothetical protein